MILITYTSTFIAYILSVLVNKVSTYILIGLPLDNAGFQSQNPNQLSHAHVFNLGCHPEIFTKIWLEFLLVIRYQNNPFLNVSNIQSFFKTLKDIVQKFF